MNFEKIKAMEIIRKEFIDLNNNPIANIGGSVGLVDENDYFEWQCSLMGPKDTSYAGGVFFLKIKFPDNYPNKPPEVAFITPIYHINVNPNKTYNSTEPLGHVCISTLNWWKPTSKIREVLSDIFALFYMANPDSPYGLDRANEFRYDRSVHEEKIRYFTKKYASYGIANKEYDHSWDFSFA